MGEDGQTVLAADGATWISVEHRHERCRMTSGPEGVFDHKPIDCPILGALGRELAVVQSVFPDHARAFGIFGRETV